MKKLTLLFISPLLIVLDVVALSHSYKDEPQLVIHTEMHTDKINRIGVNKECTKILTGSTDRTAKLWGVSRNSNYKSSHAPELLKTYRPPIDLDTDAGKIYTVALSPDEKLVAVTGYTPAKTKGFWVVYIFNAYTEELLYVIDSLPGRAYHLAFSKDGRYLAASLKATSAYKKGIKVWDLEEIDKPTALKKNTFTDFEDYGDSYMTEFDDSGDLYTVSYFNDSKFPEINGFLRSYSREKSSFKLKDETPILFGKKPYGLAIQPKGDLIAVSLLDDAGIKLFRRTANGLALLPERNQPINNDIKHGIAKVAWSSDGKHLIAGGSHYRVTGSHASDREFAVRIWSAEDIKKAPKQEYISKDYISHILPCDQGFAAASVEPSFGLLDIKGKKILWKDDAAFNMLKTQSGNLKISSNGAIVGFGSKESGYVFNAEKLALILQSDFDENIFPLNSADEQSLHFERWNEDIMLDVEGCKHKAFTESCRPTNPILDDIVIAPMLREGEDEQPHRASNSEEWTALAITSDKKNFVMASEWRIRAYDVNTRKLIWSDPIIASSKVWSVNISADSRLLVSANRDGTIRWYNMENGEELLALFVDVEYNKWIAWTPTGYYKASIGGEDLIGWHMNNGALMEADYFAAYNYRKHYSREDIVSSVLTLLSEGKAITNANRNQPVTDAFDSSHRLPILKILTTPKAAAFSDKNADIIIPYSVRLPLELRLGSKIRVEAVSDGVSLSPPQNIDWVGRADNGDLAAEYEGSIHVSSLPERDLVISLLVSVEKNGISPRLNTASIKFKYNGKKSNVVPLPTLFGLIVGVADNYNGDNILKYADKDARNMRDALTKQKGTAFSKNSKLVTIVNNEVNKKSVITELDELGKKAMKIGASNAITLVYYAGHGINLNDRTFYMMPAPLNQPTGEDYEEYVDRVGISEGILIDKLLTIPGRKILMIDACNSGSVDLADFVNKIGYNPNLSAMVYTSSGTNQRSYECAENGCFTAALVDALNHGKAGGLFTPKMDTSSDELRRYLSVQVPKLQKGQIPDFISNKSMLPIVIARETKD